MTTLIVGLILFFLPHCVGIFAAGWREQRVQSLGLPRWKALYSVVSLAGLILIIYGYGIARSAPVALWLPPPSLRHVAMLLMLPVFVLLIAAYVPSRIGRWARHPMLVAVKLWAVAHLLVNGMLADVLLFGTFLIWAIAVRISLKRRAPRPAPQLTVPYGDAIALVGGLAIYLAFVFWWHLALIGRPIVSG